MANCTDCTMSFSGDFKILEEIEKEAKAKEFCDYEVIDITDGQDETRNRFWFNCSGSRSADSDWFKDTCFKYGVEGQFQDAEAGSDFFTEILVDSNGSVCEDEYEYFCKRSVEVYEIEYFYDYFYDTFESIEDARNTIDKFVEFGEVEYEVINHYFGETEHLFGNDTYYAKPDDKNKTYLNELFKDAPLIGESKNEPLVVCKVDDVYIIEAEKKDSCSYEITGLNFTSGEWESRVIHLGHIALAKIANKDALSFRRINLEGKLVA